MLRIRARGVLAFLVLGPWFAVGAVPAARAADEQPEKAVIDDILAVLKKRGDIEEDEYQRLVAKNAAAEKKEKSLLPTIKFFGDLRGRMEAFWYQNDGVSDRPNRFRARYRARLGATSDINE